jgi:DUF1365 family protein
MHSALYHGWVRHRRKAPVGHAFRYRLFMLYLDLAELPEVFDRTPLWSARRPALAWFRRKDYLGPAQLPLDEAVRARVEAETGVRPEGPVRMLTHLRYFGYCMNPVTFYYCFDRAGEHVQFVVAEINNTPWDERHAYVLDVSRSRLEGRAHRWHFGKSFHVSPFMPMDMDYDWRFDEPAAGLHVHMENLRGGERVFDATLDLERRPITAAALNRALFAHPFMTLKVAAMIYWHALRLLLKRVPFHTHPAKLDGEPGMTTRNSP